MIVLSLLWGCSKAPPAEELPLVDTGEPATVLTIDTGDFFPVDTGFETTPDLVPSNTLFISQLGQWGMSPAGGPYTSMIGQLLVEEYVDARPEEPDENPPCYVEYALTGSVPDGEHDCPDCSVVFEVLHYVNDGDLGACRDPDVPQHEATWQLGLDEETGVIWHNYQGTGVWVAWYLADKQGDDVLFDWSAEVAVEIDEEEM